MGAAASRLPDRVDADVARAAFGDRFSRDVFDRLADGDGTCARHLLRLRCRLAALGAAASLEVCPADAARATLGLCVAAHATTDAPLGVELQMSPSGASWGALRRPD